MLTRSQEEPLRPDAGSERDHRRRRRRSSIAGLLLRLNVCVSVLAFCNAAQSAEVAGECEEMIETQRLLVAAAVAMESGLIERTPESLGEMERLHWTLTGAVSWEDVAKMDEVCDSRLADALLHFADVYREWRP